MRYTVVLELVQLCLIKNKYVQQGIGYCIPVRVILWTCVRYAAASAAAASGDTCLLPLYRPQMWMDSFQILYAPSPGEHISIRV